MQNKQDLDTNSAIAKKLNRQLSQQAALANLGQLALSKETSFDRLLDEVTQLLTHLLEVEFSLVSQLIVPPRGTRSEKDPLPRFLLKAGVGWQVGIIGQAIIEGGLASQAGYTLQTREPVLMEDYRSETRFKVSPIHAAHGITSALTVLIGGQGQEQPYGVLGTASTRPLNFDPADLQFLQALANTIAAAYQRQQAEQALLEREAQLRHSQKMESVGRLAGGIAHDFNNLLTAINGYSDLIIMSLSEDDPIYSDVTEIKQAGQRAASLTRQLLAFSRQQVLQPQIINLKQVVAEMDKMLRRLLGEDVELVTLGDPVLNEVKADPGQIEQIIVNLAVNARDAMPEGGKLTIETANVELDEAYRSALYPVVKSGDYVMLAVSDTGSGMSQNVQEHLFEPFFTTKEAGKGTGLGLSTVYGIVQQSEGYIWVYSELGVGTTFKIYLPVAKAAKGSEALKQGAGSAGVSKRNQSEKPVDGLGPARRILVVEDDNQVRELISRVLRQAGYTVLEAANGLAALNLLNNETKKKELAEEKLTPVEVVLTDVIMPGMSGREFVGRLKQSTPYPKILVMSGYTDRVVERHRLLEECDAFLQKPFTPQILLQRVQELIACSSGKSANQRL